MAEAGPTRRGGRRSSFEQSELIAVALALGPDDLDVRSVADALAVPRTTVYNHVKSPEELGRIVLSSLLDTRHDAATGRLDDAPPWQGELESFALRVRDRLLAAGPWLRYYDPDVHIAASTLRDADRLIGKLVDAGFAVETAGHALSLITSVVNTAVEEHGRKVARAPGNETYLTRFSEEEFPWIAAARVVDDPAREEDQFRFNLRCALAGIAASSEELIGPVRSS
jgi:TetR/AcrR family tetracycline transcriptional repressor